MVTFRRGDDVFGCVMDGPFLDHSGEELSLFLIICEPVLLHPYLALFKATNRGNHGSKMPSSTWCKHSSK